jgi:Ni,Fe-hydrogenase I small subunit
MQRRLNVGEKVSFIPNGRTGKIEVLNHVEDRCFILWDDTHTVTGCHISFLRSESEEIEKLKIENGTYEPPDMMDNLII